MSPVDLAPIVVPEAGLPAIPEEAPLHERLLADPRIERVLIPHSQLEARIATLAAHMARDCAGLPHLTLAIVLTGAVPFGLALGTALARAGGPPLRFEYVRASTYGAELKAEGESHRTVRIDAAPNALSGRDVLLVEDLVDQAFTLPQLQRHLRGELGVNSLRTCVLAEKMLAAPSGAVRAQRAALRVDYVGFRIPDRWIAGYGLDAGGELRELPCIVTVHEHRFRH